jgi:hypothetical protein
MSEFEFTLRAVRNTETGEMMPAIQIRGVEVEGEERACAILDAAGEPRATYACFMNAVAAALRLRQPPAGEGKVACRLCLWQDKGELSLEQTPIGLRVYGDEGRPVGFCAQCDEELDAETVINVTEGGDGYVLRFGHIEKRGLAS